MDPPVKSDTRRATGEVAEQAAADHLLERGWSILARNVRWREGELDIVALDGGVLVFVEVKGLVARGGTPPFSPFDSIGRRKQQRVRALARRWMTDMLPRYRAERDVGFSSIRFDAIAVTTTQDGSIATLDHLADAF